ncbi:MAG: hypothetical protein IID52_08515 [Proteobacteria bacterium]|nr:hypothetical protein [Pseudomonadota bacterium]
MLQRTTSFHEVSHPIYDGMVTYKGLREARVSEYVSRNAAKYLAAHGAALVGIDSPSIDDTTKSSRPVNTILLRRNIPFIEHMINLENVPKTGGKFFAVPPRIKKVGCFPVRAFIIANS